MDPCVGLVVVFGAVFVVLAAVAHVMNVRQRRMLEALAPRALTGPIDALATAAGLPEPEGPAMHRTTAPLRLALLRALLVLAVLAFPALFLATGRAGFGPGHAFWVALSAHAALAVVAASLLERRAARLGGRAEAALVAGGVAVLLGLVGAVQSVYTAAALFEGQERAWTSLGEVLAEVGASSGALPVLAALLFAATWGLPLAAVTYDELERSTASLVVVSVVSFGAAVPGVVLLALTYQVAAIVDRALGGTTPPGDGAQ